MRRQGGPAQPSINASSLAGRPKVQFGYIGTMKLPGNQVRSANGWMNRPVIVYSPSFCQLPG
jgi:hypothetical protein